MLSQAELDIVRRDLELPGLEKLFDAEAFCDALRAATADMGIRSAKLRYLRYKPGQNCLAAYTLDVNGATVECHAKAYRLADAEKFAKAELRANVSGPLGEGRFVWPRLGIEVCIFPNDNKLASLPLLTDAARREDFLKRHLPEQPALWQSSIRTLAYKPERRWVGALEVNGAPLAVCKLYGAAAFEEVRSKSKHFASGEVLRLAPLLGRSKGRGALFFGWQPGQLLSQAMIEPSFDPAILFRVGVALAELQRQTIPGLPVRADDARTFGELGSFIGFLLPHLAERLRSLVQQLITGLASSPRRESTIHGDFYAKQILLAVEHVTVLDLDEAARGDAGTDLGSFLAHLEREVIGGRLAETKREKLREQFLRGYGSAGGEIDSRLVDLHVAARLFARLPDFFRNHDLEWPQRTEEMLARIESLVGKPRPVVPLRMGVDAKLPALEPAMRPEVVGLLLASALRRRDAGIEAVALRQIDLRRHKPGRRALIAYQLELQRNGGVEPRALLGKLRRRGVDAENLELVRELSAGSFSAASTDGICVPELYGAIPELGMTLQRQVEGCPLAKSLPGREGLLAARRAADAICKLHHSQLMPGRTHTISDELDILQHRLGAVAALRPEWAERLATLLQACQQLAMRLHIVSPRPVHRDFYHDQLLLDGQRVWLLDLDLLCAGDPALDAGNFIGHLIEWGVREPSARVALNEAAEVFEARFQELSGRGSQEAVEIYTTLTLARHVSISTQFTDRAPFTEEILELCEERCGLTNQSIRGAVRATAML